jgi:ubiquinone/menaquinone biosynthesis C-methylase UbiE
MSPGRLEELAYDAPVILHGRQESSGNRRFEGLYGAIYNHVIQSPRLRKAAFSIWGSADPLYELDSFVADAVHATQEASPSPVLVDLPSGGGTLLPFFAREALAGTVVEVDLAAPMLRRAVALRNASAPRLTTVFLLANALDLPLKTGVADIVVSINGLHVIPDHERFLTEIARITKPGGRLWMITPVDAPNVRSKAILGAANLFGITPTTPPTLAGLYTLLQNAGFAEFRPYGGRSITGLSCQRS